MTVREMIEEVVREYGWTTVREILNYLYGYYEKAAEYGHSYDAAIVLGHVLQAAKDGLIKWEE